MGKQLCRILGFSWSLTFSENSTDCHWWRWNYVYICVMRFWSCLSVKYTDVSRKMWIELCIWDRRPKSWLPSCYKTWKHKSFITLRYSCLKGFCNAKLPKHEVYSDQFRMLLEAVVGWCMEIEVRLTQDQFLICPLVLIILSLSKTASTPWPPALLCKQEEEGGKPWKHTHRPTFSLCVQCENTVVGSHLHWRVSVLRQNQTEHVPWKPRGVRPSLCFTASLPLQHAHPLSSPRLHPCYLPSHPSPLLPFVLFFCAHFTVSVSSSTP